MPRVGRRHVLPSCEPVSNCWTRRSPTVNSQLLPQSRQAVPARQETVGPRQQWARAYEMLPAIFSYASSNFGFAMTPISWPLEKNLVEKTIACLLNMIVNSVSQL